MFAIRTNFQSSKMSLMVANTITLYIQSNEKGTQQKIRNDKTTTTTTSQSKKDIYIETIHVVPFGRMKMIRLFSLRPVNESVCVCVFVSTTLLPRFLLLFVIIYNV